MNFKVGDMIYSSTSEYEVQRFLGSGSFGFVVQCWKKPANEAVALKIIMDRSSVDEAKEEVDVLNNLKTQGSENFNVVKLNDYFIYKGYFCIDFELLDVSLFDYTESKGSLHLNEIRPILKQLAEALCFLENARVSHTDLKPENIMMVDQYLHPFKVKVIDFGWALFNPELWTGYTLQTLLYRAPEVLVGAPFDRPVDVWSLGCIAAEMFMGTVLFPGNDEYQMLQHILHTIGQPPDHVMEIGSKTKDYFNVRYRRRRPYSWTLKLPHELVLEEDFAAMPERPLWSLDDIITYPNSTKTDITQEEECDRACFVDLLKQMLDMDADQRISPREILDHPFITLSHFNGQRDNSYVQAAVICMMCIDEHFDGGINAQLSSSDSNSSDRDDSGSQHPQSGLSDEELPSVQHTDSVHLDWISSSSGQNEEEAQRANVDDSSPKEKILRVNSSSKSIIALNKQKASLTPKNRGRKRKSDDDELEMPEPPSKRMKVSVRDAEFNSGNSDFDGGKNAPEPFCDSSSITNSGSNHSASEHPPAVLNMDKHPSAHVSIRGVNKSRKRRHLDDQESVSRSSGQNEEEAQHMNVDNSSPKEKILRVNSSSKSIIALNKQKASSTPKNRGRKRKSDDDELEMPEPPSKRMKASVRDAEFNNGNSDFNGGKNAPEPFCDSSSITNSGRNHSASEHPPAELNMDKQSRGVNKSRERRHLDDQESVSRSSRQHEEEAQHMNVDNSSPKKKKFKRRRRKGKKAR